MFWQMKTLAPGEKNSCQQRGSQRGVLPQPPPYSNSYSTRPSVTLPFSDLFCFILIILQQLQRLLRPDFASRQIVYSRGKNGWSPKNDDSMTGLLVIEDHGCNTRRQNILVWQKYFALSQQKVRLIFHISAISVNVCFFEKLNIPGYNPIKSFQHRFSLMIAYVQS